MLSGPANSSSCSLSSQPTSPSNISKDASRWFQPPSLCIVTTEASDIMEQRQANPTTVPCLNSWPKETVRITKWLFYVTKFGGSLFHSNCNWNTSPLNLAGLLTCFSQWRRSESVPVLKLGLKGTYLPVSVYVLCLSHYDENMPRRDCWRMRDIWNILE